MNPSDKQQPSSGENPDTAASARPRLRAESDQQELVRTRSLQDTSEWKGIVPPAGERRSSFPEQSKASGGGGSELELNPGREEGLGMNPDETEATFGTMEPGTPLGRSREVGTAARTRCKFATPKG